MKDSYTVDQEMRMECAHVIKELSMVLLDVPNKNDIEFDTDEFINDVEKLYQYVKNGKDKE